MKKILILPVIALCMVSCRSSKEATLQDLRGLTTEIQTNASDYNFKDWLKEQKKYQKIDARLRKYDYSTAENEEIGQLKGQCLGYFAKGVVGKATNKVVDAYNQLQGIVNGIQNTLVPSKK